MLGSRDPRADGSRLEQFLGAALMVSMERNIADRTAQLRLVPRRAGRSVDHRALDLFIAATAIEYGLSLVTRNTRDDSDIPGLDLYSTT